jgi:dinuclear metal center YbgI/SA1388 family protein
MRSLISMSAKSIQEIVSKLEEKTPKQTAESWDNVGLLVGDSSWKTTGAVVSIDLTREAIQLAKKNGFNLIINHHPCIFPKDRGLPQVTNNPNFRSQSLVFEALSEKIAVISCHTNFDRCAMEVVEQVSQGLKIRPMGRLMERNREEFSKLVVFVPETHVEKLRNAICEAGAGQIGNYDFCTFNVEGTGTFRGQEGSKPFIGKTGKLEKVQEIRLETILPTGLESSIVKAMKGAHPYEEVAYDVYSVKQSPASKGLVKGLGYGFWGEYLSDKPFSEFVRDVRSLFGVQEIRVTEPAPQHLKRVGFVAGKGSAFLGDAQALGCDVLVTGEVGYHDALGASWQQKMTVIELGHRESEKFFVEVMQKWLSSEGLQVVPVQTQTQKIWST